MRRRERKALAAELIADCEAFLTGRYAERISASGVPVPAWVWTNQLAHGSEADLRAAVASHARQLLADERRRLESARSSADADLGDERPGSDDELAVYEQDPSERGTELADLARDLALRDDFLNLLAENDEALQRLEDGHYGRCERCGRPIADDRLRAMPSTRLCVEHQSTGETR